MDFSVKKQIEYWRDSALSDIETAEILIDKGKLKEGLFFCHLCIEKILKGHYVKNNKEIAPKVHQLYYLYKKSGIKVNEEYLDFFGVLMVYQLEGRYPDYQVPLIPKTLAKEYYVKTKEILKCLNQML